MEFVLQREDNLNVYLLQTQQYNPNVWTDGFYLALQLIDDPWQCSLLSSSRSCSRNPLLGEMFLLALTALMASGSFMFSWIIR